jgi:glycosyltransferase involved in cell wall biosynthesis
MKILYISPQHISGFLDVLCAGHSRRGNSARFVTLFPSAFGFPEDLSLKLPLHPDKSWIIRGRRFLKRIRGEADEGELPGNPPMWSPGGRLERLFFNFRDDLIAKKVYKFLDDNGLWDFDLYHLEQGADFFRDCRTAKEFHSKGKKIACFYHGNDIRNRGVFPAIHKISDLNLTSELDLLARYPGIKYLFLPIDTKEVFPKLKDNPKKKIAHATRSRYNKGSDFIIATVRKIESKYPVELVLIENKPHADCMALKAECDIYIDQIADRAGWGYGMSSVESLAQGLATCTYLNPQYAEFIPDHPFVNVNYQNLEAELVKLIADADYRAECAKRGREWVVKTHDIEAVLDKLYGYYSEVGIV